MKRPILSLKKTPDPRERAKAYLRKFSAISEGKPLAIGIHRKLLEHAPDDVSKKALRRALWNHTRRKRYLKALAKADSQRHWLDGTPVEPVSEIDRRQARDALEVQS